MNVRRILAIAALTVRDAIRSRLLVALTALLLLGLCSLPALIQGDGSLPDRIEIVIRYAIGFAAAVLALTTLWTACGGIAREIEDRRLYLVVSKPVHRYEIWLGKWVAIMGLNAALLALTGLLLAGMLAWALRPSAAEARERQQVSGQLLTARVETPARPPRTDFESLVRRRAESLACSNGAPSGTDIADAIERVRREMTRRAFSVVPSGSTTLAFTPPPGRLPEQPLTIAFKPESSRPNRGCFVVKWLFGGAPDGVQTTNYPGVPWRQTIAPGAVPPGATLTVTLVRQPDENPGALLLAPDGSPPSLLVATGTFGPNLIRALTILWCRLAFLAALGLSAGCLLSMPVAVCVAGFILVLLASAGYVRTVTATGVFYVPHEGSLPERTWVDATVLHLFKVINVVTRPLAELDPLPLIAEGRRVGWAMTARAILILAGLYTGVAAAAGVALFRRRELG
jgi:hypothetical protein